MKKLFGMVSVFLLFFIFNEEKVLAEEYVKSFDISEYSGEALMIKVDGGVLTKITNGNGKVVDNYTNKLFSNIWIYRTINTGNFFFEGTEMNVHVESNNSNIDIELIGGKFSNDFFDFTNVNLENGNFIDYIADTENGNHELKFKAEAGSSYLVSVDNSKRLEIFNSNGSSLYSNEPKSNYNTTYYKIISTQGGEYTINTEGGINRSIGIRIGKFFDLEGLNIINLSIKNPYDNYYAKRFIIEPLINNAYTVGGFSEHNDVAFQLHNYEKNKDTYYNENSATRNYLSEYYNTFTSTPSDITFPSLENSIGFEYTFKSSVAYNGVAPDSIFRFYNRGYVPRTGDKSKSALKEIQAYQRNIESAVADPVDSASGAFFDSKSLLKYGGSEPLEFNVKYNSILNDSADLASGWVHNYESSIEELDDLVNINWDPNSKMVFNKLGSEYIAKDIRNKELELSKDVNGNFIFKDRDHSIYIFDSNKKLKSIEYKTGNIINLLYGINGKLMRVENNEKGQHFTFEYNSSDKLIKVIDKEGREVLFTYSSGNLEKINDANGKVTTFTYISSSGNKIGTVKSNEGITFVNNSYDKFGRVISQRDGRGYTTYFSYDEFSEEGKIKTIVKDRLGKSETFIHDDKYQLIGKIDKNGYIMNKEYDENGNIIKEIDFNGNEVIFEYDENNNLTKETYEDGKYKSFEYDSNGNLTKLIDEDLNESVSFYDTKNRITKMIDSMGNNNDYIYNDEGYLWKIKDSMDNETTYEYDFEGYLIGLTDKEGNKTIFENDVLGRVTKTILPEGNITQTVYDGKGNVIKVIDENGDYIENTYDSFGSITKKVDKLGRLTTYTYDGNGNLTNEQIGDRKTSVSYDYEDRVTYDRDKMDKTHSYIYDNNGRVIKETDRANNVTEYVYDNNGNVIKKTLNSSYIDIYEYDIYDQIIKHIDADGKITLFEYNSKGLLIKETNHLGYVHKYNYDSLGNLISEEDYEGRVITYVYNSLNKLISKTDARGNIWLYEYNKNGLLTKEINPLGQYTKNEYDGNGNLLKVYNSLEEVVLENIYDNLGRIVETKDALGNSNTFEYDKIGNLTKSFDSKGNLVSEYVYNNYDEITVERDINGNEKKFEYNKNSELIKSIDELNRNQQYRYDGIGRLLEITDKNNVISKQKYNKLFGIENYTDANNYTTNYLYDKLGRVLSETNSNSNKINYEYNSIGFMTKYINSKNQSALYEYDKLGNILKITEGSKTTNFEYDENNNLLKVKETGKGTIERIYDELNRVVSYKDVYGNIIGYEYDIKGNLSKIIYPGNLAVTYEYDLSNRLIKITDWHHKVTRYKYDENGRLIETSKPDGSSEVREYDNKGKIVLLKNISKLDNVISEDIFNYDLVGNVITEGEENYQYDVLDRLLQSNKNKYTYDKGGNLLTYKELVNGTEITDTFTYSRDNRLTKAFNTTTNLDADGNLLDIPLNGSFKNGVYDSRNRLISLGNDIYSYDDENTRTSVLENGIETRFLVDKVSNSLSRTLLETDNLGNVTNYYVYGLGLINSYNGNNTLDSIEVYHYDMRGSTIGLTDKDSFIIGNVEYDTYGEILNKDGSIKTKFLYNGKLGVRTDNSGLYHMRARYYSPEIKRFINRDVVVGNLSESQTFNRFAYVNGNPISYIDPFGLSRTLEDHTKIAHGRFEIFGLIPGLGILGDGANSILYFSEGKFGEGFLNFSFIVPGAGDLLQYSTKGPKTIAKISKQESKLIKNNFDSPVAGDNVGNSLRTNKISIPDSKIIDNFDYGNYLKKNIGLPPSDMYDPHAHHILFKKGNGRAQKELVKEGQDILIEFGIDPIFGMENLVWAPNRVKGQHGIDSLRNVVDTIKDVKYSGGDRDDMVEALKILGKNAQMRR